MPTTVVKVHGYATLGTGVFQPYPHTGNPVIFFFLPFGFVRNYPGT